MTGLSNLTLVCAALTFVFYIVAYGTLSEFLLYVGNTLLIFTTFSGLNDVLKHLGIDLFDKE